MTQTKSKIYNQNGIFYYNGLPCEKTNVFIKGKMIDYEGDRISNFKVYDTGYILANTIMGDFFLKILTPLPMTDKEQITETSEEYLKNEYAAWSLDDKSYNIALKALSLKEAETVEKVLKFIDLNQMEIPELIPQDSYESGKSYGLHLIKEFINNNLK